MASATARRKVPVDWRNIKLCVFDCPSQSGNFIDLLKYLHEKLAKAPLAPYLALSCNCALKYLHEKLAKAPEWVEIVQQTIFKTPKELNEELRQVCANGGEGLMLRQISAPYIPDQHCLLLKLKPLDDAEATVIAGHKNGKQSVKVRDAEGREFRLTCADQLPTGTVVTYQFNGRTKNGISRPTTFLRIR